ncbi:MAG: 4Fe-4S binding protein [Desulfovibrio sp.]|nr:4Fe-4S binding protein [Desulfovibrio sp.]
MEGPAINIAWCKGCGICVAFCPRKALHLVGEKCTVDPVRCVLCGLCELYCPDLAITVDPEAVKRRTSEKSGKSGSSGTAAPPGRPGKSGKADHPGKETRHGL